MVRRVVAVAVAALVAVGAWVWLSAPTPVAETWTGPVASMSFAPFRDDQSPLAKRWPSRAQIDEDLKRMPGRTHGVRTYTSNEGMEAVPQLAEQYGLTVTHSAWLDDDVAKNAHEIEALIDAAHTYPGAVKRVIVGNEVLLRGDLKPDQLVAYIRQVKQAVAQPVSYADVWAFYLKYPQVGREVDFITIHILPYWEDEPTSIDDVDHHFADIIGQIRAAFPGKPILIGEAGWPSEGRNRGPAVANMVTAARFVRMLPHLAAKYGVDYNVVEAFDQPWKAKLEGTVGAHWGVIDRDRRTKFDVTGPVAPFGDTTARMVAAVAAGAALTLAFARRRGVFAHALLAQLLAGMAVFTAYVAWTHAFGPALQAWAVVRIVAVAALTAALADVAARTLGEEPRPGWSTVVGDNLATLYGLYALVWTALLAFDGRYRDVPEIEFLVPVAGVAAVVLVRAVVALRGGQGLAAAVVGAASLARVFHPDPARRPNAVRALASLGLAAALGLAAVANIVGEGFAVIGEDFRKNHPDLPDQAGLVLRAMVDNREILLWSAMLVVMALPYLADVALARGAGRPRT